MTAVGNGYSRRVPWDIGDNTHPSPRPPRDAVRLPNVVMVLQDVNTQKCLAFPMNDF